AEPKVAPGGRVRGVARWLGPRSLVLGRPEELKAGSASALRPYPHLGSRQIPEPELVHPARLARPAGDDPRRPTAVRVREIVQAHHERRGVLGKHDAANLADPPGIQEQNLARL